MSSATPIQAMEIDAPRRALTGGARFTLLRDNFSLFATQVRAWQRRAFAAGGPPLMATDIHNPVFGFQFAPVPTGDESFRQQVKQLISRLFPSNLPRERRTNGRYPFPFLVRLTPVDERTFQPVGEPLVVVGKDLSERGIGFFHPHPLPYRRAIVTLEDSARRSVSLLIDLSWCRFTRLGWYESGGRFLQIVSSLAA